MVTNPSTEDATAIADENARLKTLLGIVAEIKKFLRITKINLWSILATRGIGVHLHTLVDRERKRSSERG